MESTERRREALAATRQTTEVALKVAEAAPGQAEERRLALIDALSTAEDRKAKASDALAAAETVRADADRAARAADERASAAREAARDPRPAWRPPANASPNTPRLAEAGGIAVAELRSTITSTVIPHEAPRVRPQAGSEDKLRAEMQDEVTERQRKPPLGPGSALAAVRDDAGSGLKPGIRR